MNIYVIGAGGMLGAFLVPYFESKGHIVLAEDMYNTAEWVEIGDVRDYHRMHYVLSEFHPQVIINLAALTDLEYCETHAGDTIDTNTGGSANCAALASKFNIPYVYISTAGIFDGKQDHYVDWDTPNPLCVYAKTKYWGELIASAYDKGITLRCGWQMGSCKKDKKFIGKIMKQLKAGATELNVVTDKLGTPTYVKDFTLQIEKLLEGHHYGVWNAVCRGEASRYDVAVELLRLLGLQNKVKVNIVDSSFWAKEYFAPRPSSEKLVTKRLDLDHLNIMRPWQECLAEYVKENPGFFFVKG
jgi:dTDP-4-dehydrorhamnose reductase